MTRCGRSPGAFQGAGLVEVLVTVLILAVGLLGLVGVQLASRRAVFEASQRTIATTLARDMLERMRSNPSQLERYVVTWLGDPAAPVAATDCAATICRPAQLAAYDLQRWHRRLTGTPAVAAPGKEVPHVGGLVAPRACIEHRAGAVTVVIAWKGLGEWAAPPPREGAGVTCGQGNGLYGEGDAQRRMLRVSTYIGGGEP